MAERIIHVSSTSYHYTQNYSHTLDNAIFPEKIPLAELLRTEANRSFLSGLLLHDCHKSSGTGLTDSRLDGLEFLMPHFHQYCRAYSF